MEKYYVKFIWCIPLLVIVGLSLSSTIVAARTVEGDYASKNSILQQSTGFPEILPSKTPTITPTVTLPFDGTKVSVPSIPSTPSIGEINNPYPTPEMIYGTETPLPNISTYGSKAIFSFKDIRQPEISIRYPAISQFRINFPDRWLISPSESYIEIHYSLAENGGSNLIKKNDNRFTNGTDRPYVQIRINNFLAGTFYPEVGTNLVAILKLPFNFVSSRNWNTDNAYNVEFDYTYGSGGGGGGAYFDCNYDGLLTIHTTTAFNIAFRSVSPALTLAEFPRVLIQNSFIPETLYFVIPDEYNDTDLSTIAQISVAIGKSAPGANLEIKTITASHASTDLLLKSSAIILGEPARNKFLTTLYENNTLATQLSQDKKQISGIGNDEGLLQLIQPRENKAIAYLAVTGNSEKGIQHAANSLLYPPVGLSGLYFITRSIYTPKQEATPPPDTYAISDFGFSESVFYTGINSRGFSFYIPRYWTIQGGVKLVINYAHSNNLSYANSAVTIYLNNSPIGSIPLNREDNGELHFTINLPKESIIAGALNDVRFEVSVINEIYDCSQYNPIVAWVNIRATSLIYLPYKTIMVPKDYALLHDPIFYLQYDPNYIAILPQNPKMDEISGLANISKMIGSLTTQYNVNVSVSTNPKIDSNALKNSNVLIIGKPSRNSLIQTINNVLPQPFVPGEDNLTLQQKIGLYRVEQSIGTGVVQSLTSPWNESKNITVFSGTNDDGIKWAFEKISSSRTIYDFLGELNFVQADRVVSYQTKIPAFLSPEKVITDITGQGASLQPVPTLSGQPVPIASAQPGGETNSDQYISTKQTTPTIRFGNYAINGYYIILGIIVIALIIATISITSTVRGGRKR